MLEREVLKAGGLGLEETADGVGGGILAMLPHRGPPTRLSHLVDETGALATIAGVSQLRLLLSFIELRLAGLLLQEPLTYPSQHEAIIDAELWQLVQEKLAGNRQARALGMNAEEPSLLAGLILDGHGQPHDADACGQAGASLSVLYLDIANHRRSFGPCQRLAGRERRVRNRLRSIATKVIVQAAKAT